MDPLSLTANIIAVVGAAKSAGTSLKRLREARSAPHQLSELLNEVSDFEKVIATVENTMVVTSQQPVDHIFNGQQPVDPVFDDYLGSLIQRAKDQMTKISQLAEDGWIKDLQLMSKETAKAAWKMWLKSKDILDILKTVHSLRQDIAAALTVLTASELPHVRNALREIVLRNHETRLVLKQTTNTINDRMNSITDQLSTISPRINDVRLVLEQITSRADNQVDSVNNEADELARNSPMLPNPFNLRSPSQDLSTTRIRSTNEFPNLLCNSLCICNCHKSRSFKSPSWAKNLTGVILLSWSGVLGRPICNQKRCRRSQSRMLKLDYYFPFWFTQRVIFLGHQFTALENHKVHIRISRVIPGNSAVFISAMDGDADRMRSLFSAGHASPFDIDERGQSVLANVLARGSNINNRHVEMCRLLLQQSADPRQADQVSRSPVQKVWSYFLCAPKNPHIQALKAIFDQHLDAIEDLEPFGFTIIHKIVLGLSQIDLSAQLEHSTADIDTVCSAGKTPLYWAILSENEAMVRKLLEFDARVDIRQRNGFTIFFAVQNMQPDMLQMLISAAHSQFAADLFDSGHKHRTTQVSRNSTNSNDVVKNSVTALLDAHDEHGYTSLTQCCRAGLYEHARILISYGVSLSPLSPTIPLLISVQYNHLRIIKLLLGAGASTSGKDLDDQTILHLAGIWGDIKTLKLLKDAKLCCLSISEKDVHGRSPLEAFDVERLEWRPTEDPEARRQCREAFIELLESVKPTGSDHICTVRGPAAITERTEIVEDAEIEPNNEMESDNESFYEARSTFEDDD